MISPDRSEYISLSGTYNLIPVSREINADLDTPISIYKKTVPQGPAFLLESVEGGENLARYSFIGFDPFLTFDSRGDETVITFDGNRKKLLSGTPLEILEQVMSGFRVPPQPDLPRFFGGAVGYIGFDAVRFIEKVKPVINSDPATADLSFIFAGTVLVFDHVRRTLTVVVNSIPGTNPGQSYSLAEERIMKVSEAVRKNISSGERFQASGISGPIESNISREDFMAKVIKAKEYIKSGDILQVVLSRRLRASFSGDPFEVYRRLRALNPSPYLYYLNFNDVCLVGSSPEMMVRVDGQMVETCPIAGTRPRGDDAEKDAAMAAALLADEKEKAEHLMLVDLGRNDLGKVCEAGSVKLTRFMDIEKFSHVMHLVSHVVGRLAPGKNCFDALKACFPAGTVSGAPKVRAMEIIGELEPDGRGIYAGAIGYFGFSGNLDTAIAIRTVIINNGQAYIQAGAGIVADSDPELEYQETMNKARALLKTLENGEVNIQ